MTDTLTDPPPESPEESDGTESGAPSLARRAALIGGVPFLLVVIAIVLVAGSAITWVTSPNWGKSNAAAPARDIGVVPTNPTSAVPPVTQVVYNLDPNRIEIPKLHADAPIQTMGEVKRELDIPLNPKIVGWWNGGAHPGASTGTAVLAGHINYAGVTGELAKIGTLDPGDHVFVSGFREGKLTRLEFVVNAVRTYRKTALPFEEIFNQNVAGRLAIITCGGPFDSSTGNYLDNIVVYATPTVV
jgi:hypothetical protein